RPFTGNNTLEVMHALLYNTPLPAPNVSPAMQDILEKALAKDPEERYQSASDFALDLRRAKRATPVPVESVAPRKSFAAITSWLLIPAILLIAYLWFRLPARPQASVATKVRLTPITTDEGYEGE